MTVKSCITFGPGITLFRKIVATHTSLIKHINFSDGGSGSVSQELAGVEPAKILMGLFGSAFHFARQLTAIDLVV